ncbi:MULTISPECIES: hypothetical protein [unclassified Streptomyces]|uniref:hypothetical protein n=1 Tax=unclassified Streptomyces TaxID=2593676 RepID=UPI00136B887F|nr:hypothetical protein [Streptomyces sp. SID4985]MYQ45643.1 hypothetical protein [Streptomyces sp. SID4985]
MTENEPRRTAPLKGVHLLLDLRSIIAALFGIYGTVLTAMGASGASAADLRKTGGWNVNLWCGLAMLAFAASFAAWTLLRPLREPVEEPVRETPETVPAA